MPSNHLILCRPLLLLPSNFPSIRVFSNESPLCISWPKYYSFSFSISPSSEYSGLISFSIDWFDILAVQGTLKSVLQHHSSKASMLQHSAFLMVQLSHPYMTTGKTIALTRWTFVGKVMSLLFNMLSRLVIAFLPRSKWKWKLLSHVQLFATPWTIQSWNSPGQNTGVDSLSLLQGIFLTQGSNPALLHCRRILYQLTHKRSSRTKEQASFNFMDAVTICSDFGVQEKKICHYFQFFPFYMTWSDGTRSHSLSFFNVEL